MAQPGFRFYQNISSLTKERKYEIVEELLQKVTNFSERLQQPSIRNCLQILSIEEAEALYVILLDQPMADRPDTFGVNISDEFVDAIMYFMLTKCIQTKYGTWYNPNGFEPSKALKVHAAAGMEPCAFTDLGRSA